jgi:2-dehydro-3-deoxyphosphooctonate aldolase (KDO 8-P synthase)
VATRIDGVFLEVHEAPERALSDGANALPLSELGPLLTRLRAIDQAVRPFRTGHAGPV